MQALKKSIHDAEMCLEQHRRDAHQQTQELKTVFLQKISDPKVLLGGLSVGVLLGLLRGKRRAGMHKCRQRQDAGSDRRAPASAEGKPSRRRGWLRTIKTLVQYAPIASAAAKSINTLLQKQKKTPAAL